MKEIPVQIVEPILWLASKPKRIKIAVGGRGSGKSTAVADLMLAFADGGERVCCTREFQNSIDDSVHENLCIEIQRLDLETFTIMASEIHTAAGGNIFYKGLARNITSLKSIAGVKKLWIEEGESISDKSLKVLTPSIRSSADAGEDDNPPEIWITMNRGSSKDAVAKKYLKRAEKALRKCGRYEDDLMMVVEVNWRHNPWFPPELEQERQDDFENLPRAEYMHIWEGHYNDSVENAIIQAEWFDACIDAHEKLGFQPMGQEKIAYDPADSGDDKAIAYLHGSVFKHVESLDTGTIDTATDWATSYTNDVRPDVFLWDCDGMGAGLKRQITDAFNGKQITLESFKGSEGAARPDAIYDPVGKDVNKPKTNKQMFTNQRAQHYWALRDRMFKTWRMVNKRGIYSADELISFSSEIPDLDGLRAELCRIPRKFVPNGRIQLLTKQEMKKIDIDSPNMADACMMCMKGVNTHEEINDLEFDSEW